MSKVTIVCTLLLILTLGACDALGGGDGVNETAILSTLSGYFSDINAGRWTSIYQHFHTNLGSVRDNYMGGGMFQSAYATETPISYSVASSSGSTYRIDVEYSTIGTVRETFNFAEDGSDWKITSCTAPGGSF